MAAPGPWSWLVFSWFAKTEPPVTLPPTYRDPLTAIPLVTPGVEARADAANLIQLRYQLPARSRLEHFFAITLQFRPPLRINLDERGSCFWRLIDGERNLHRIAERLGATFSLPREQANQAVMLFTRELMRRGVIRLEIRK